MLKDVEQTVLCRHVDRVILDGQPHGIAIKKRNERRIKPGIRFR